MDYFTIGGVSSSSFNAYIYDLTFLGRNDMVLLIDGENDTAR